MAYWKVLLLAHKAHKGWKRIPPEQRKRMVQGAGKHARKHGPVIAKRIGTALQQVRKGR
jgi:acyl-CoA reductase-like NAD-dependent aldehyde dehydrogenase